MGEPVGNQEDITAMEGQRMYGDPNKKDLAPTPESWP